MLGTHTRSGALSYHKNNFRLNVLGFYSLAQKYQFALPQSRIHRIGGCLMGKILTKLENKVFDKMQLLHSNAYRRINKATINK